MPLTTHVGTLGKTHAAVDFQAKNCEKAQEATDGAIFTRMPYPDTPFDNGFNTEILVKTQGDRADNQLPDLNLKNLLRWLCTAPKISSIRVNTIVNKTENVLKLIKESISNTNTKIEIHSILQDVIIIYNIPVDGLDLKEKPLEVIVDLHCGASILRGAHIFAPGVVGMQSGIKLNDQVSIYVDLSKQCKKGYSKVYNPNCKAFIGNGIVKKTRKDLFGENKDVRGIAIEVYSNTSGCPNIQHENLPVGCCLLQNLPSIICVYVLSPKPNETVLDMCAAPGNKTTHIAALMKNKGQLIAIEKILSKIERLKQTCEGFKANVTVFCADSTKILCQTAHDEIMNGPPFLKESFDRILLDAPCSALGQRPQFYNNVTEKVLRSYVPLQRKLFENAVKLLKVNGTLVYSTCTITLSENEGIVSWAIRTFDCLKLVKAEPYFGSKGWPGTGLSDEQLHLVQRFDHKSELDSVGFFIACFVKVQQTEEIY